MQTKITANEWQLGKFCKPWWVVNDSKGDIVVEVLDSLENAQLIAAAPDMLKALREAIDTLHASADEHSDGSGRWAWETEQLCRAALIKATGREL